MIDQLSTAKKRVCEWIEHTDEQFTGLARKMYEDPELGFAEEKAAQWLSETLTNNGYAVEKGIAGLKTAFRATLSGTTSHPIIALLCEYDALPDIGHGCGHNLIGTASVWAGSALAQLNGDLPGTIIVFGCPGEETDGGKVIIVNNEYFANVDAAMMFHPSIENRVLSSSLAIDALEITFHGRTAHAAGSPHLGINALDAVIQVFNGINALRQHLTEDVRIHGIITEGGKAPNVVPDLAQARFYLRARDRKYLNEVVAKFKKICEGASLMTGATYDIHNFENSNDNLISNEVIGRLFEGNLRDIGVTNLLPRNKGGGSTDMGNVSQVVPAIHAYLAICGKEARTHSREFARATISQQGLNTLKIAAKTLAMTTLDLIFKPEELAKAKEELQKTKQIS